MRAYEFLFEKKHTEDEVEEWKASPKQCRSSNLGASAHSSCVAQGLIAHQSKGKGHTTGQGTPGKKGTGVYTKTKKLKSAKYGGPVKDYS